MQQVEVVTITGTPEQIIKWMQQAVRTELAPFADLLQQKQTNAVDDIVGTAETMKILKYKSADSVYRDVKKRKLTPVNADDGVKVGKRGYRFKRVDVERLAQSK